MSRRSNNLISKKTSSGEMACAAPLWSDAWHQAWILALLVGLLVVLTVYYDAEALDLSLLPRLRGLYAALMGAVLLLLLPQVARRLDFSVLRDPLILCYAFFSFICFATLPGAMNPSAGFTDAFKTFGAFVFLCLLCLLLPTLPRWRERLLQVLICGGLTSACWGLFEMVRLYGFGIHSRDTMENVIGTMANVNLYAGFLTMVIPFCLSAAVVALKWWRWIAVLASASGIMMVLFLQTRAAWLGMAGSLAVGAVLAIAFSSNLGIGPRLKRNLTLLLILMPAALAVFYFLAPASNPMAARLHSISIVNADSSFRGRLMAWQIALQMARDHFPWGVGTGNFTIRLDEYFNALTDFGGQATNWIYPHNDFLWVFAELGLPGIAAFVAIFALGLIYGFVSLRRSRSRQEAWLALAVIMALIAYLVDSNFSFPLARISQQVYLATILAVSLLLRREPNVPAQPAKDASYPKWLLATAVAVLGVLVLGFQYCRIAVKQEVYLSTVFMLEEIEMWPAALRVIRAAASPWKTTDVAANPWAYHEARILKQIGTDEDVLEALQRAYTQNPNRMHVINDLGSYLAKTGRYNEAIALLSKTVERYPGQTTCVENLAQCYIDQDDYAAALEVLERVPENKRMDSIRRKITGCRQALGEQVPAEKAVAP